MNIDIEPQVQIFAKVLSTCLDEAEQKASQDEVSLSSRLRKIQGDLD
jgi:hypothetical protein